MPKRNQGYAFASTVHRPSAALAWLVETFPHTDIDGWRVRLEAGEVRRGELPLASTDLLRRGDVVVWHRPPWVEPDVPLHFGLISADDDLVVVDKPSGLPTMPAGGFLEHTLLALVRREFPDAAPMHRLGRGTSGLVVFASTPAARSAVQAVWRRREVEKIYRARVVGTPPPSLRIDQPIGPVNHPRLGEVFAATPTGRPSTSHATLVETDGDESLVDVQIDTGRPHQIRIHLAAIGHPLVGDPLYGPGGLPRTDALPGDLGYALHAWRLSFVFDGHRRAFEAPLPPGLRTTPMP